LLLPRARWSGYVFGGAAVALATGVLGPVMEWTRLANSSAVYTIPVLLTAALYDRGPALATSLASITNTLLLLFFAMKRFGGINARRIVLSLARIL